MSNRDPYSDFGFRLRLPGLRTVSPWYGKVENGIGCDGRGRRHGAARALRAAAYAGEDVEIEEVHAAEDEQDHPHFVAEQFNGGARCVDDLGGLQGEGDETDVDQVEADDQQMVDRVGQFAVAGER